MKLAMPGDSAAEASLDHERKIKKGMSPQEIAEEQKVNAAKAGVFQRLAEIAGKLRDSKLLNPED